LCSEFSFSHGICGCVVTEFIQDWCM
jgi:hypothetical protein